MSEKIIWITSYPKSGNTFVRSILSSLLYSKNGNFNFDLLDLIELFEQFRNFEFIKEINTKDYNNLQKVEIISKYWIDAQKNIINNKTINPIYNIFKTHNANLYVNSNIFTTPEFTAGLVYIIRDPREVVISYSKHMKKSIDQTIDIITNEKTSLRPTNNAPTSIISSWDLHYKSWQNLKTPKLLLKYEDLIENTLDSINKLILFMSNILKINKENLESKKINTFDTTNIDIFRKHEQKFGFKESSKNTNFFGTAKKKYVAKNSYTKTKKKNRRKIYHFNERNRI